MTAKKTKAAAAKRAVAPKPTPPVPLTALPPTSQLATLSGWLTFAEKIYERAGLALGQVATNAHDEALYLFLHTLDWPIDSDASALERPLTPEDRIALRETLARRAVERVPAAYITREAFLGEHRFYVDERTIIPRSYFLEIIPDQLDRLLPAPDKVNHVVDICTGSGCLAILLAHHFPKAEVDAIDISPTALEVASINVRNHRLGRRISLHQSNVFDGVRPNTYDIILSNPPYEPSSVCDKLPAEFLKEPRLALDGGSDGLDIVRKILAQSRDRLAPGGIVILEVGGLRGAIDREFAKLKPEWLTTADGSNCVCVFRAERLKPPARRA